MRDTEIDDYLKLLIGQPLLDIGRAANIIWFSLGELIAVKDLKGNDVQKSTLALHFQCPWRIVDREKKIILFASSDLFEPNSTTEWTKDFDWDIQGINLFDEKSKKWIKENKHICVVDLKFNMWGDLKLLFSNGNILDVFINSSTKEECWRFFEYNSNRDHFVVNGKGVLFEYEIE